MPAAVVDGNDVWAVHEAAHEAVERARSGGGPTLLEYEAKAAGLELRPEDAPVSYGLTGDGDSTNGTRAAAARTAA